MTFRSAVLIVSDKGALGERADTDGPAVAELLPGIGADVVGAVKFLIRHL